MTSRTAEFLILAQTGIESEIIDNYLSAEFIVKRHDVGSATLVMPGRVPAADRIGGSRGEPLLRKLTGYTRGYAGASTFRPRLRLKRLVPFSGGTQQMVSMWTGDLVRIEDTWDMSAGPTTTLRYECDNRYLRNAVVKPTPTGPPYTDVADIYPSPTTIAPASSVLLYFAGHNCGSSAYPTERWTISTGADPATGSSLRGLGRWQNLLVFLQEIAAAGGITFQVIDKLLSIVTPSGTPASFSLDDGGMRKFQQFIGAPTKPNGNYLYVAGAGTGASRTIFENDFYPTTPSVWGYIEQWIDRSDIAASAALYGIYDAAAASLETSGVSVETQESWYPLNVYGGEYGLGSPASVTYNTTTTMGVIEGCRFTFTSDGAVAVLPTIGLNPQSLLAFGTIDLYGVQIRDVQRNVLPAAQVSTVTDNTLTDTGSGLYVPPTPISATGGNIASYSAGGIYVPAPATVDAVRVVVHGAVGSTARPTCTVVFWIGTATPANAVAGDLWDDGL